MKEGYNKRVNIRSNVEKVVCLHRGNGDDGALRM